MRKFLILLTREVRSYFYSPVAYIVLFFFLVVTGFDFNAGVALLNRGPQTVTVVEAFFNMYLFWIVFILMFPMLTMRTFAEEYKMGTIETLMTAPVSSAAVVLAKYAAALTTYVAMWAPTVLYLVILAGTGSLDWQVAGASYLGVLLVGAAYLALGLLASAVTKSQFLALVLSAMVILVLFILGIAEFVTAEGTMAHDVCAYVSVWAQMNDFASGIVDLRHLAFNGTLIVLPLFITTRAVDAWRWG